MFKAEHDAPTWEKFGALIGQLDDGSLVAIGRDVLEERGKALKVRFDTRATYRRQAVAWFPKSQLTVVTSPDGGQNYLAPTWLAKEKGWRLA